MTQPYELTEPGSTIAVVGASARAAAFSLLRARRQVATADLFADADLARRCEAKRVTPYPAGFEPWLAQTECDAWIYTGALENHPELIDRLSDSRPLVGHAGVVLRRVRDPLALQTTLTRKGLHFPETRLAAGLRPNPEWLGKTCAGSCGNGVGRDADAIYWQRRVEGVSLSAVFVGSRLLGVTRQLVGEAWTGAREFHYCGSIAPWPIPSAYEQQLRRLGELLSNEFGMTALYGVDLIDDGERLWTIEVNPRYTAAVEVVERAYGVSVFASEAIKQPSSYCGKVVLYAKKSFVVTRELSEQLLRQAGEVAWPKIADIPSAATEISVGQPVLTLFAEGESCSAVKQLLRRRVEATEKKLYFGEPRKERNTRIHSAVDLQAPPST